MSNLRIVIIKFLNSYLGLKSRSRWSASKNINRPSATENINMASASKNTTTKGASENGDIDIFWVTSSTENYRIFFST